MASHWPGRQSMKIIALKVDVDTLRGTLEGVPALMRMLSAENAQGSFLFSLGPDHTGRAIKRVFRPGFLGKVQRTSVVEHYGLRTLLYGTLLPGPDIGLRGMAVMRAVRDAGFETAVHTWDHVAWQDNVQHADDPWTITQMIRAETRYLEIFGTPPTGHGAAGWQMNDAAFRHLDEAGYEWASDGRGNFPFRPVIQGKTLRCPQFPTTLPTLDELLGLEGRDGQAVVDHVLSLTAERVPATGHVFTLHAELEGMKLAPLFAGLLSGWKSQGYRLASMAQLAAVTDVSTLPRCAVLQGEIPGRSGTLTLQGPSCDTIPQS